MEGTVPNFVHTTHAVTVPPLANGREIARRPVLIAGGGPVGLGTIAAAHGVGRARGRDLRDAPAAIVLFAAHDALSSTH